MTYKFTSSCSHRKFLLLTIFILLLSTPFITSSLHAQCNNPSSFGSAVAPSNNTPVTITTCAFAGEYSTVTSAVAGRTYLFNATGGAGNFITIRQGTPGGTVLGFGTAPISVVCTVSGSLYLHYNTNASCGTESACRTGTVQCTSCTGGPDPCTSIITIACGASITAAPTGTGVWNVTSCGFSTPGQEKIYSFTPLATGPHSLQVTAATGGFIDYFIKTAAGGCSATGWTCIDDIISPSTVPMGTLTAGTTYYILLDPEGTGTYSHTFNIICPVFDPCTSIPTLTCGVSVVASATGTGVWSPNSCGFTTPGQERVYSFTPTTTGVHSLQVTASSGGFVDYFFKLASVGCNATGWNCIDDIFSPTTATIGTLTAGTTYYILADPEVTSTVNYTFNILCPPVDPCGSIVTLTCNTAVTSSHAGSGLWSPGNCGFATPGQERVYSFTPTTTGVHSLQVNSASGGFMDYFYKDAAGGCNATGWTCIDDISSPLTAAIGTLNAGTVYYILVDSEVTGTTSQNFQIVCGGAPPPCATNPSPANANITCPNTATTLSWTASPGATSYDVYFGTTPVPPFVANVLPTSYNAGTLAAGTYYWQVRPRNVDGPASGCTIWTFTKADNTPPTITCPPNITVSATAGLCSAVVTYGAISATDNCTAPTISLVSGLASGSTFPVGLSTIVYRATDSSNNSATCAFTVRVNDTQPPTITCPPAVTVQCASTIPAPNIAGVTASDNCGPPSVVFVSDVTTGFICTNRFNVTRTYRATDAAGNTSQCTQMITVNDITAPTITFNHPLLQGMMSGATIEVQCYGQDPAWDPPVFNQASVTATDNCTGTSTVTYTEVLIDEGNCLVDGYINLYRLRWIVTDACGNSTSATINLELVDELPPTLSGVPSDITVNCDEIPEVPPADAITAVDECLYACNITFSATSPAPGCQDGQIIQRTWTATDECGNSTVGIQNITLVDEKGPELFLTHPQLQGIEDGTTLEYTCNAGGIPSFYNQLTAQSVSPVAACGGTPSITFESIEHAPRNCEFFGYVEERELIWTGVDQCGNESTFTLIVHLIDDEVPVLVGVPDMACEGDPALNEVEAIDNCENGGVRYWDVLIPNPCGNGNAKRRTYEGFDPCGNMVRDTAIILPADAIAPEMSFTNPVLQGIGSGGTLTLDCTGENGYYDLFSVEDVRVDDACPQGLTVAYEEKVIALGNCANGSLASLELTWTASDMCGNQSQLLVHVEVIDQTPPVMQNFNSVMTISCNDELPQLHAKDNCGEVIITSIDVVIPGVCEYEFDVERTITATDPCGNTLTSTQIVHVRGKGPVIHGIEETVCNDLSIPRVTATDPCTGNPVQVTMTESPVQDPCEEGTVINRTWSATDACGHQTVIHQRIIMNDVTPPVIQVPTHSVILRYLDVGTAVVYLSETGIVEALDDLDEYSVFIEDECDEAIIPVFSMDVAYAANCSDNGYFEHRVYTWVATDICGNSSEISFSVDVIDDVPPVITNVPGAETFICTGLPAAGTVVVTDYTENVSVVYSEEIIPGSTPNSFDVIRTWTATDECGNISVATQKILWIPDTYVTCDIILPVTDCNTHNVIVTSEVSGGLGELSYEWTVEGIDCYIESGQGTSAIGIYVGFTEVEISLTVTDAFGCSTVCESILDCDDPLGDFAQVLPAVTSDVNSLKAELELTSNDQIKHLSLWPQPSNDKLNIQFVSDRTSSVDVQVFDLVGQHVYSQKLESVKGVNKTSISTASIAEGSYLMQLKTSAGIVSKIIVIVHPD